MAGFYYPRTPSGKAAILPPVPWHYSGELITFEYRTNVDAVRALLPDGLELADEDPGAVAAIYMGVRSARFAMIVNDGEIFLRSGAGIVADSDPEAEFQETLNKSRALIEAIDYAREGFD